MALKVEGEGALLGMEDGGEQGGEAGNEKV
jgi:hypothetical protein